VLVDLDLAEPIQPGPDRPLRAHRASIQYDDLHGGFIPGLVVDRLPATAVPHSNRPGLARGSLPAVAAPPNPRPRDQTSSCIKQYVQGRSIAGVARTGMRVSMAETTSEALSPAEKVRQFPTSPGLYLMKDAQGRVLYIGKAKNLRARAGSYFHK